MAGASVRQLGLGDPAPAHGPDHLVGRDAVGADHLREPSGGDVPAQVHLEEPVLGGHVALRPEQVLGVVGVDLRHALVVAQHRDGRGQPAHRQLAARLGEGASHEPDPDDRDDDGGNDEEGDQGHDDTTSSSSAGHPARLGHRTSPVVDAGDQSKGSRPRRVGQVAGGSAVRVSMLVQEFTLTDLDPVLAVGSLVLLVSVAAVRLAVRSGLPSLLLYLAIGIVIGEAGFGIEFESTTLTQVLGYSALVAHPGRGRPDDVLVGHPGLRRTGRRAVDPRACWCRWASSAWPATTVLHVSWTHRAAHRRGAVRPPTPRRCSRCCAGCRCRRRVTGLLEAESGFNDAPVVLAGGDPGRAGGARRRRTRGGSCC